MLCIYYAPGMKFKGIWFLVWLLVTLSGVKNFNFGHNFRTLRD